MLVNLMVAPGCEVACDQCRFGSEQAGCLGACVHLAYAVRVRSGCSGACGQIVGEDEFVHDANGVQADGAACVMSGVIFVGPL